MASTGASDLTRSSSSAASKPRKHKKRKPGGKIKVNGIPEQVNGTAQGEEDNPEENEVEESETPLEVVDSPDQRAQSPSDNLHSPTMNGTSSVSRDRPLDNPLDGPDSLNPPSPATNRPRTSTLNKVTRERTNHEQRNEESEHMEEQTDIKSPVPYRSRKATIVANTGLETKLEDLQGDTETRLEALARERALLKEEVSQLRRSLEEIRIKHEEELGSVKEQLEDTLSEKEQAETQYRNLLGKVNSIKSQLGERLKADAEDLGQARSRIEELEEQNGNLQEQNDMRSAEVARLAEETEQRSKELSSLRNRLNLSQQNWSKEREDLVQKEAFAKEEFESAKQAMQDWEILAMEERSIRENLQERVSDLEEQVSHHRESYEKAATERDSQSLTVDGLQRALQEIQEARKRELREVVENSQTQVGELRKQMLESQEQAINAINALESTRKELQRALPFEAEVKEKNLLIGKLRHEAVILNDHLTKALRYLKKGKPEDNIDKQLVSNHFLHFVALERSDPKKFQILQIIAALLGWTDEQREQAGLARPGASNPNLKAPVSPWHRTPSTPALSTDFFPDDGKSKKESLAGLWSDFLEQEAQDGASTSRSSRSTSIASGAKPS